MTLRDLRENDQRTWNIMKEGSSCVAKSELRFTSTGTDRGIEHDNRASKVLGRIKGLGN